MKARKYKVVDVFTHKPLLGNPVAVVLDADGLDAAAMQRIARWTNLSETTFVVPPTTPGADYRLRIFTPHTELPFAGHPTLGSAHAALEAGLVTPAGGKLVQECGVGLIDLAVFGVGPDQHLSFRLPPAGLSPLDSGDIDELESLLGHAISREVAPAIVDVGAVWLVAQISSVSALLALEPDLARSAAFERRLGITGISVFAPRRATGAAIEVRSFAPSSGVGEDPVCGSGNGAVAVLRRERGLTPAGGATYTASQGQRVGRDGLVEVEIDGNGEVVLGGSCVTCVEGILRC